MVTNTLVVYSSSSPRNTLLMLHHKNYFKKALILSSSTSNTSSIRCSLLNIRTTSLSTEIIQGNSILMNTALMKKKLERTQMREHFYASVTAANSVGSGIISSSSSYGLYPQMLHGLVCLCVIFGFWRLYRWVVDRVLPVLRFLMLCMKTLVLWVVIHGAKVIVKDSLVKLETDGKSEVLEKWMEWEKFMEDPTVQELVYPYLPVKARINPMFKWMLQNPLYRQLQCVQENMVENNCSAESIYNFELTNPEIKLQLDEIGSALEEVILGMVYGPLCGGSWQAFSEPRVLAAISECVENRSSIAKYQQDKKVLKVMAGLSVALVGLWLPDACIPSLSAFNHDGDAGGNLIIRQKSKN